MAEVARGHRPGGAGEPLGRRWPTGLTASSTVAAVLLVLGVLLLVESRRISGFSFLEMGPEVYPRALAVLVVVTALICLVAERRSRQSPAPSGTGPDGAVADGAVAENAVPDSAVPDGTAPAQDGSGIPVAPLLVAGSLLLYVWAIGAVGFYSSSFAFTAVLITIIGRFSGTGRSMRGVVVRALVMALLITAAIYGAVQLIAMRVPTTGLLV